MPEMSLEVTSPTSVEERIQTSQGPTKEEQSREIARLPNTRLSSQFRVCSLGHCPKQFFLIRWPGHAE
jgi:hypothetical protein